MDHRYVQGERERACRLGNFSRGGWYRKRTARDQSGLRMRIRDIAMSRPRFVTSAFMSCFGVKGGMSISNVFIGCIVWKVFKCACGYAERSV